MPLLHQHTQRTQEYVEKTTSSNIPLRIVCTSNSNPFNINSQRLSAISLRIQTPTHMYTRNAREIHQVTCARGAPETHTHIHSYSHTRAHRASSTTCMMCISMCYAYSRNPTSHIILAISAMLSSTQHHTHTHTKPANIQCPMPFHREHRIKRAKSIPLTYTYPYVNIYIRTHKSEGARTMRARALLRLCIK